MAAIAQPPPVHTPTLDEPPQSHLTDLLPVNPPLVLLPAYAKTEVTTVWIDSVSYVSGVSGARADWHSRARTAMRRGDPAKDSSKDNFFVKDENNNVLLSSIGKEWSTRNKKSERSWVLWRPANLKQSSTRTTKPSSTSRTTSSLLTTR
jgi:hypothetical protein